MSIKNRNFLNSLREEINRVAIMRRKPISPKLSISFSIGLTPKEPLISLKDHRKLGAIIAKKIMGLIFRKVLVDIIN
tara:strand:+ start:57 stop:287 length:231 start_codon:yes stop_codon:yes gene_type:complete